MALAMIAPIAFEGVVQPFRAKRRVVGDEEHYRFLEPLLVVAPAARQPLPILREPLFIRRLSGERGALTAGGLLGRGDQRLPEDQRNGRGGPSSVSERLPWRHVFRGWAPSA